MRGRKPKPTALHHLHGTFNVTEHRDRQYEPVADGDLSQPPDWLTPTQREAWLYAVDNAPANVLKRIDAGALATWVVAYDQHREATVQQAKIDAGNALPLLTMDKRKQAFVVSPYVGIINRAGIRMLKAASELGFTPAARPRLAGSGSSPPVAEDSPWSEFRVVDGGRA